ncbi:MAG: site-specific DNA-methyltransferase [Proteobacteria bacterium]|nr:site-specific DNA-methyltransferase [Pseudomonadota bacterium]
MTSCREKFKELLRELFQFDCADLDFGIYRIMNYKRDVIEKFITQDLPKAIADELDRGALAAQSQAAKELKEVAEQITQTLGKDALDADGNLAVAYHNTPLGKKYQNLKGKAAGGRGRETLEASIFNHLYAFFSRYYQDGDFISKRRYSKRQKYAIPYNGEEVYLYWANNDQYYVKTAEHFHDYTFTSRGVIVHFKLMAADVEQNDVKGDKRFFLPRPKETEWDEDTGQLIIPFESRPLTEQEEITYGKKNQQDAIIAQAIEEIPKRLKKADKALVALTAERQKNSDGQPVTFLEHHLRQYTRRNTSDFFIHKDLKGFLSRELDFYLKNEVLNLDEMETAGEDRAESWFQMMQVIKTVGGRIIEFLDQIESFQKMLWEKRKFITETQYCITVGNIDGSFYPDISACEPQWGEWKDLFHIDEEQTDLFNSSKSKKDKRIAFLKAHPTLVLDTNHFHRDFVDRLLGSFDALDEKIDGLLVHSENLNALNLLLEYYKGAVQCIHIDPPYNTETSGFLYKNAYQHSSWLCMMLDRILASYPMLNNEGSYIAHVDENEYERLHLLFESLNSPYLGTVVWDKRNPMMGSKGIAVQHEYILLSSNQEGELLSKNDNVREILRVAGEYLSKHAGVNDESKEAFAKWVRSNKQLSGGERAYHRLEYDGRVYRLVAMTWPNPIRPSEKFFIPLIHPVTGKPCPVPSRGWSRSPEKMKELLEANEIEFGPDETTQPQRKIYLSEDSTKPISSVVYNGSKGKPEVEALGLTFSYCHPVSLYEEILNAGLLGKNTGLVLDHFAGSATTGHSIINMNRDDGGERKFVLVDMGDFFDSVLLARIKKVSFAPEWKDGKPKRMATQEETKRGPRIVKYIRLESYEDALNNIEFDDASGQQALKFDDYLLRYMLRWETRASETMLSVERLARPFSYKLHIHANGQTREKVTDIPETFNYLLGLHVQTRRVYDDAGRRYLVYRGLIDHRQIAVIWRETEGWQKTDLERDKKFVAEQNLTEGADEVFVNGDSFIPNAKALEPLFKARMFAEVQA